MSILAKFTDDHTIYQMFIFATTNDPMIILMIVFTDEPTIIRKIFYRRSDDHISDFLAKFYQRSDDQNRDFLAIFTYDPTITVYYFVSLILP